MARPIIQQLKPSKTRPLGIISPLLRDVRDLLASELESTVAPGIALRGATIAYMPGGSMCTPPSLPNLWTGD